MRVTCTNLRLDDRRQRYLFSETAVYFMMHRPLKIRDTPPLYSIRIRPIRFNIRI